VHGWVAKCQELGIPVSGTVMLCSTLGNPVEVREWMKAGLPTDGTSIDNGILVTRCKRWPLMIDPQVLLSDTCIWPTAHYGYCPAAHHLYPKPCVPSHTQGWSPSA
jgi:hypothetical protein